MIKVIMLAIIFNVAMCVSVTAHIIQIEAALVMRELVRISDVPLIPLQKEGLEDVPAQCRIMNEEVEKLIRNYANDYKGGTTPVHIAQALNDLMHTLVAVIDSGGDNNGILSEKERMQWKRAVMQRNSLFLLWCLYIAYLDVDIPK